jgi:hypothetical protein
MITGSSELVVAGFRIGFEERLTWRSRIGAAMADRSNHYEAAFEAYIRSLRIPCVAIDEARRALSDGGGLKSPDFLLYPRAGLNLVVEVKGKRGKNALGRRRWENWVTTDDLDGLARWQELFGPSFRSLLAFVYAERPSTFGLPPGDGGFSYRGRIYRFWAVGLDDYVAHLRSRGPAWKAVAMARQGFRRRVRPLEDWLPIHSDLRAPLQSSLPKDSTR